MKSPAVLTRKQIFGEISSDLQLVAVAFQALEPMSPSEFRGGMTVQEIQSAKQEFDQWRETASRIADRLESAIRDFDKKEFLSLCGI